MALFGLQVFNASGVVVFDSIVAAGSCPVGVITAPGTYSYPLFAGRTLQAVMLTGDESNEFALSAFVSINNATGTVTVAAGSPPFLLAVF